MNGETLRRDREAARRSPVRQRSAPPAPRPPVEPLPGARRPDAGTGRYDAVIAGGGLAGLSLAAHLAAGGWADRSVLVVDDPTAGAPAVSWGFWSARRGLLDSAVCRTYEQVRVHAAGASWVLPLAPYRYQLVRRDDLRRVVAQMIEPCPGFAVRQARVQSVREHPGIAEAIVDGEHVYGSWLFDSVTRGPAGTPADARLAFTGWEVRCSHPVFDPGTPTLFDFRTPQEGGARFVYILPSDPCRALVELTEFVPRSGAPSAPAQRDAALAEYLADVARASDYEVLRTESAVLPLRVRRPARGSGRVRAIGARGGLVKASTGYAYQRIQRDSDAIAASLVRYGNPSCTPAPHRRYALLDAVLLEVLDRDPAQLERAFARLFQANPAERVLRFLDEDPRVRDDLRLIASLPPGPYMRTLTRLGRRQRGPHADRSR